MPVAMVIASLLSVLFPAKGWYGPEQPLNVTVRAVAPLTLVMTDFTGKPIDANGQADVSGTQEVDIRDVFPALDQPGAYILYAVPKGKALPDFVGTPLVVNVLADKRIGAPPGPMVIHIEPLCYAVMSTNQGDMALAFYYDVAPGTVDNFLRLSADGFYNGLTFHRIVPGFVLQGGDPRGDGTGGPGYSITAEFNKRPHEEGVLSMARNGDPAEAPNIPPRPEYANSAGSQFFICLDYNQTRHLDGAYTAFGKVVTGMEAAKKMAAVRLGDPASGKPAEPQVIKSIEIRAVGPGHDPYRGLVPAGQ